MRHPEQHHTRNPLMEQYFHSLDFFLNCDLFEECHEIRCFDDFLNALNDILKEHEDEIYFYTGWNYRPIKETINNRTKKTGICKLRNDETIDIPIYIKFYNRNDKSYTNVNRKDDKIILFINEFNLNLELLPFELQHEFTHVVCDYSEKDFANLDSLRNSIGYDDDIFKLDTDYDKIMLMLYWLNRSEQEARICSTLGYVRKQRKEHNETNTLKYVCIVDYIKESYFLNQLDIFHQDVVSMTFLSNKSLYALGYYMQMHHYIYGNFFKDIVAQSIENNDYDLSKCSIVRREYKRLYEDYRRRLYNAIAGQTI